MGNEALRTMRGIVGTRHLIEVKLDGELKIAQYGQWDGYPTGCGRGISDFLHKDMNKERFKDALRACRFMTQEDIDAFNSEQQGKNWQQSHPWLSRDAGSDVLKHVQDDGARLLQDEREFKNDRTSCEYHYLIDMDNETVAMNGGEPIPFSEWTAERMKTLDTEGEEEEA
jgi:endonuclease I